MVLCEAADAHRSSVGMMVAKTPRLFSSDSGCEKEWTSFFLSLRKWSFLTCTSSCSKVSCAPHPSWLNNYPSRVILVKQHAT